MTGTLTLPNFVIGGAPKCGTSSVFGWLADHPEVCGSSVKEPFYLMDRGHSLLRKEANYHDHALEGYARFFSHGDRRPKIVFEATTHYLFQTTAREVLAGLATCPRVVFILRHPAERLYSSFRYTKNNIALLDHQVSFSKYLELIRDTNPHSLDPYLAHPSAVLKTEIAQGCYVNFLEPWFERLGRDRVKVFLFESVRDDPKAFMRRLAEWLDIAPEFYENYSFAARNESLSIRNQALHRWARRLARLLPERSVRQWLKRGYLRMQNAGRAERTDDDRRAVKALSEFYQPHNQRLARLLDVDLSAWQR